MVLVKVFNLFATLANVNFLMWTAAVHLGMEKQ